MKKVIYLVNSNKTVLYFFPSTGENKYSGAKLNLSCQTTKRGGYGNRDYIPPIIPCKLLDSFLMAWHSPTNINELLISKGYELDDFYNLFGDIEEGISFILRERAAHKGVSFLFTEEDKKRIKAKIDELNKTLLAKLKELSNLDDELKVFLHTVKKLEEENNKLLESETFNDKKFSANSLKIATLKRENKASIDRRNALFPICEKMKSELSDLEEQLKALESV